MDTSTRVPDAATWRPPAEAEPRARFIDLLAAEWTKIRTIRSTFWSLAAMVVLSVGLACLATAVTISGWATMHADERAHLVADPVGLIFQPAASYAQIAVCVLAVMTMAGEYSTGTMRTTLLAVPSRWPVVSAKAVVFGAVVFVAAEVLAVPAYLAGRQILGAHVRVSGDPRPILGFGLYLAAMGLFAMGIATLVRHVAVAITAVLATIVVLPNVLSLLPGKIGRDLGAFVPGGDGGQTIMSSGHSPGALVTPWQGYATLVAWVVVTLALATVALTRRNAPPPRSGI